MVHHRIRDCKRILRRMAQDQLAELMQDLWPSVRLSRPASRFIETWRDLMPDQATDGIIAEAMRRHARRSARFPTVYDLKEACLDILEEQGPSNLHARMDASS